MIGEIPVDIRKMVEDCEEAAKASNCPFTAWEIDFVDSVGNQYEERGTLSDKQENVLMRIWDKI